LEIQIHNLVFRGVFKATQITLCFISTNDVEINKLNFVVGHGTVVQLGCTIISSGVTRCLSQGWQGLAEGGSLTKTQKKVKKDSESLDVVDVYLHKTTKTPRKM